MDALHQLIQELPKAELHLHIEGTLEPEMLFSLAQKNKVSLPYSSVEEVKAAYKFHNLQSFLDIYYQGMNVLHDKQDFYDLTWAYLEKAHKDNVCHTEIFFDPQGHTQRGVAFKTVIEGIHDALKAGEKKLGITSKLIMCFLRDLSEEDAFNTLKQAEPFFEIIDGIGLDSAEVGHPPSKFEKVFAKCRELGFKIVAHAGEEGPSEYMWQALDLLKVDRIDHGIKADRDETLMQRLKEAQVPLTVCPFSNVKLCSYDKLEDHNLKQLLDYGLMVTINSDDPSYFGGYINDNFTGCIDALGLTFDDIVKLAQNSIHASFIDDALKETYLKRIDEVISQHQQKTA